MDAIEIDLQPEILNREDGLCPKQIMEAPSVFPEGMQETCSVGGSCNGVPQGGLH